MSLVDVQSNESFQQLLNESKLVVAIFWADWHPPSKQMVAVLETVANEHSHLKFAKIEAEQHSDITEAYPVKSVPTIVFIKQGQLVDVLEGANPPILIERVTKYAQSSAAAESVTKPPSSSHSTSTNTTATASTATTTTTTTTTSSSDTNQDLNSRLNKLINAHTVMLFIKGSPDAPRCGFSRQIVEILKSVNADFGYFDILSDEQVRQGLKTFSNWPTYPQLYVNGKLVGGLDIVKELQADGELQNMLPQLSSTNVSSGSLEDRLNTLINRHRVMLFMKGNADDPRCGFSSRIVELIQSTGAKFDTFDILSDDEVRQGLKTFSNWPTYPQLYVDGKLIGGLDIALEMHQEGELASLLNGN